MIWFFTKRETDLVGEAGGGHSAMFCVLSKDQEFHACVGGRPAEDRDTDKIKEFWNPVAAAWFPDGKDDPDLTLLQFRPHDAQVWLTRGGGPLEFAWEIARANATHTEPHLGDKAHLTLI